MHNNMPKECTRKMRDFSYLQEVGVHLISYKVELFSLYLLQHSLFHQNEKYQLYNIERQVKALSSHLVLNG
jgi:hypothetical protein